MKKRAFVATFAAVFLSASAISPAAADDPPPWSILMTDELSQSLAADEALFATTDTSSPLDPTSMDSNGRQTISVSFFAGHIGPVSPSGSAHWINTDSNDPDSYSVEINIPAGGTPADGYSSFAGINFHHVPPVAPANPPAFDYKTDRTSASGGSPRLVIVFSDHGNINLRPNAWVQNVWTSEGTGNPTPDPLFATNWDNNGGSCGFVYQTTYNAALSCHAGATVTAAFIVSDSGWVIHPYKNWIDNIQYNGQVISLPPDNANH